MDFARRTAFGIILPWISLSIFYGLNPRGPYVDLRILPGPYMDLTIIIGLTRFDENFGLNLPLV